MFDRLFSPIVFGKVSLPNRICFLAHRTNFAREGRLTGRLLAYYRRRAQGGCGLIMVGELSIHPNDRPWATTIEAFRPEIVQDYRKLTNAIHEFETCVFAQIGHRGFQSSGAITRHAIWGPSAVSDITFGETPKAMEPEDVAETVASFSRAAALARDGGFDGIEIDMGPESLLRQFLSPLSNLRQDEYGGTLEKRLRFPMEVIHEVRRSVGEDFPLGIYLCGDEKFWGAITLDESRVFARKFEHEGGVDFINVSVGTYYNLYLVCPSMHVAPGYTVETAEEIKRVVSVPVIASHQINFPQMAEEILLEGRADAVGVVRTLICDPDAPKKAKEEKSGEIRPCVRDNEGCIGRVTRLKTLSCIQNPDVGYEDMGSRFRKKRGEGKGGAEARSQGSSIPKRVFVVGAGPAGMEAAWAARNQGHRVTLYEKKDMLGGQINLAMRGAGREAMGEIVRHLSHMVEKAKVEVLTGVEVTAELILRENPDAVIVATGSRPKKKPVRGDYGRPQVLNVWEIIVGKLPVGEKILFIDEEGSHRGTGTIELLADQGKRVHVVTSDLFVGFELGPLGDLYLTRQRLLQKGVKFTPDVMVDEIEGSRVKGRHIYTNEAILFEGYDTIVLNMGSEAVDHLYKMLKGRVKRLYRIGDCVAPRDIGTAIFEGKRAGEAV